MGSLSDSPEQLNGERVEEKLEDLVLAKRRAAPIEEPSSPEAGKAQILSNVLGIFEKVNMLAYSQEQYHRLERGYEEEIENGGSYKKMTASSR